MSHSTGPRTAWGMGNIDRLTAYLNDSLLDPNGPMADLEVEQGDVYEESNLSVLDLDGNPVGTIDTHHLAAELIAWMEREMKA